MGKLISFLLFCLLLELGNAGNYLFYLPLSSKSVKLGFMPMAKELAQRNHTVYIVSPIKEKKTIPNIIDVTFEGSKFDEIQQEISSTLLKTNTGSIADAPFALMFEESLNSNRHALQTPELQKILFDESFKIDVVMPIPVLGNEIGNWIAHKKDASLVHFVSVPFLLPYMATAVGSPINPSYITTPFLPVSQHMNFLERLKNTLFTYMTLIGREFYLLPRIASVITDVFPNEDVSDFSAMTQNVALAINMGSPFTGDGLRPVMPNVVRGGLMSCRPGNKLEGELKDWVEGAKDGVIYVSFGSVVKAHEMPEERRKLMISVLSKLKQRVVWKWEKEMPDLPANIKVFSWLPQLDLLAHPNVKLFVTHGGAGSVQETICYKTPIVGIPIAGDQMNNLVEAQTKHLGIVLPWYQVTQETLQEAIATVLEDDSYLKSVTRLQELILDAPLHPLENTVWWLEYLLRHPHNSAMRSAAKDLYWFQYLLLDVIGFILLALYIAYRITRGILSLVCSVCCGKSNSKQKTQ